MGFGERLAARGWRVVAPDLRGHGDSPRGAYSMAQLADDLVATSPPRPALAIGHSLGGAVLARALAGLEPARAVYADPAWRIDMTPAKQAAGRAAITTYSREQWHRFLPRASDRDLDAMVDGLRKWDMDAFAEGILAAPEDLVPTRPPAVPSLILLSGHINFDVDAVAGLGYQVARLREVSHLMFWDDPEQCLAIVMEWLAANDRPG
jgi:pimeloyl-ACP methyl ester carboxylesterase